MILRQLLIFFLVLSLSACQMFPQDQAPYALLNFKISDRVNPDQTGRPSPVVVKVFELSSRTLFDSQDFFALYDDAEQVLGADLIQRSEFSFQPNSRGHYQLSLAPGVRYAAVLVAYRNLEAANWRDVVAIDVQGYHNFEVDIGELSVFIAQPHPAIE